MSLELKEGRFHGCLGCGVVRMNGLGDPGGLCLGL